MNTNSSHRSWPVVTFILITLVLTLSSFAQTKTVPVPGTWDTSINPHDFTNLYYTQNGVIGKAIIWRRNGADGLSVYDKPAWTYHRDVRVIATVPAYDQTGAPYYWTPLGELTNTGFTDDKIGFLARQTASLFPIYIFPDEKYITYNTIAGTRQAPLIDNSWGIVAAAEVDNPLGLREVFLVNYTEKAHGPDGVKMMAYMGEKNGLATDSMPLIKSMDDMHLLMNEGFISFEYGDARIGPYMGHYAISPIMAEPTKGIAKDAFLWMSSRDGKPLEGEMTFVTQFNCLQKLGSWCAK